jgi:hypothetical protein
VSCGVQTCGPNQACVEPCAPTGNQVCVTLPASCDLTSQAPLCDCFSGNDPCGAAGGGQCSGSAAPGQISCFCNTGGAACDKPSVDTFVSSHHSCTQNSDCKPLCMLGSSCDDRSVNQAGATLFKQLFGGCMFDQCQLNCPLGTCEGTICVP